MYFVVAVMLYKVFLNVSDKHISSAGLSPGHYPSPIAYVLSVASFDVKIACTKKARVD
jgi:hypothetical protein